MFQDEAGFGRISAIRHCWCPLGARPEVASHRIREYRYCYGAVEPSTGESFFIVAGGCDTEWMNQYLELLSERYSEDYLLLVMDNARWHKSKALKVPKNIRLLFIPPYTPEMNPIEQVWDKIRELSFVNRIFSTLDHVIETLCNTVNSLSKDLIRSITARYWILNWK